MPSRWRRWLGGPCGPSLREATTPSSSTPSCRAPTAISPAITRSFVSCSRPRHPAGCPTRFTGGSSTVCTLACASGWWRWPPIPTTRRGISSRSGSPGSPDRLETSPELRERGERLKRDVLGSADLRDWSSSLWQKAKEALRIQAADPDSELRRRLAGALVAAGRRLGSDSRLQEGLERAVESGSKALADQFHDELAGLVTGTIERWDAAETSNQLELLLGRDLQYIRINGTVVGAGVGLILHAVVQAVA